VMERSDFFRDIRKVVVKLGTKVLTLSGNQLDLAVIDRVAKEVAELRRRNIQTVIVSSAAIAAGMGGLGIGRRPRAIPELQACAAVGQNLLINSYKEAFSKYGLMVGQVLLTADDLADRGRYVNVRNTMMTLLGYGVIPIVNENDSVATDEIKVGDNDILSAHVANLIGADLLVVLSDVDGLFAGDPRKGGNPEILRTIPRIGPEIEAISGEAGTDVSIGGMRTKIEAARIVTGAGEMMVIANGKKDSIVDIVEGREIGTFFVPERRKMKSRKRWIAFPLRKKGVIFVDRGAAKAIIHEGRSLLPSGIVGTSGEFKMGDVVGIQDADRVEFARGITNYSSSEIEKIKGLKSFEIEDVLGYKYYDEVVHRDDLVIVDRRL